MTENIPFTHEYDMGDSPSVRVRRTITPSGKNALEFITSGYIAIHGSSMGSFYVTTALEAQVAHLGLPCAPYAHSPDSGARTDTTAL